VSEVKRVTLDAGHQLNRFQSRYKQYTRPGRETKLVSGAGLKKVNGEEVALNADLGWLAKWEKVSGNNGSQGLAVVVDPKRMERKVEDELNQLMLVSVDSDGTASYWAGFCWDRAGHIKSFDNWKQYVTEFATGLASSIEVTVTRK
jgi:hypothetical protein